MPEYGGRLAYVVGMVKAGLDGDGVAASAAKCRLKTGVVAAHYGDVLIEPCKVPRKHGYAIMIKTKMDTT